MRHEFGKCSVCKKKWAVVKFGISANRNPRAVPMCLKCYDAALGNGLSILKNIGKLK